jgi:glucan biosynthesis protein C
MSENLPSSPRIPFFDNIRYLIIFTVVVMHAGSAYSNLVPLWPMPDESKSKSFDVILLIWDIFGMPVLFFIAGYFALPSLRRKKSVGLFLKSKFKHLGIPFVLFLFFVLPVIFYLLKYSRSEISAISPLEYWFQFVLMAADLKVRYFQPSDIFNQGHLWFVSLLIFFFVLFALAYRLKTKLMHGKFESNEKQSSPDAKAVILTLLFVGLATAFGSILVSLFFSDSIQVSIGSILVFQPVKLPMYFGYFLFGIYACSRNWFVQRDLPGPILMWLTACIVFSLAFLDILDAFVKAGPPYSFKILVTVWILSSFLCLAYFVLLSKFAFRHWNSTSKINQSFARNSFYIYLVHVPIVLALQFFFLSWNIPVFVKIIIISVISIALSYAISQYLINPAPKLSIVLLLSGFILFLVFMAP